MHGIKYLWYLQTLPLLFYHHVKFTVFHEDVSTRELVIFPLRSWLIHTSMFHDVYYPVMYMLRVHWMEIYHRKLKIENAKFEFHRTQGVVGQKLYGGVKLFKILNI